ncbi:hypothetical protein KK137_04705 [Croceibacterium sp. LX-88]|uniref:Baseplate protein J-like domain-containing protein n=1 Tax=Croceibacterium selenioxidans TaxID=2838833 RepID=A0ABS5W2Q9_9SPHN|nr:hypothetical protein [Croceibacterium selenioxidans]MBT2133627.1 hypothetical protein [Croceibacterium selenioxidans]
MAENTNQFGSALLALTTLRPPDLRRGENLVHFELELPEAVAEQAKLADNGQRDPLGPKEAATLLWKSPVAAQLDGRTNAWRDITGVSLLLPAIGRLASTDEAGWPNDQSELQQLTSDLAGQAWASIRSTLIDSDCLAKLNDVVLIFKYAAVGQTRSIRTAADLYRFARTLLANDGPTTRQDMVLWLTAPLVVPGVMTRLPGPRGPKKPPEPSTHPHPPHFVATDVVAAATPDMLARLHSELDAREDATDAARVREMLHSAGVTDRNLLSRVSATISGSDASNVSERSRIAAPRKRSRIVSLHLFGAPVLLDIGAAEHRTAALRSALARKVAAVLPEDLRDRLLSSGVALEELDTWPGVLSAATASPSYLEPVGRNDLLLVRQTTTGYRRTEIAYVENVMVGEERGRNHTERSLSRQEFFEEVEQETEETRDLQVTDKAELSREVSNVVQENLKAEGNVQITSRGPTTVVASVSGSAQRSTEEAAKAAEQYSRETIERAVKRTLQRVVRQTRSIYEREITEDNKHGFKVDGNATDHVSGVYQYLERVSRAKIFWYGERELYDILIPEPAALMWHFAIQRREIQIPIEAPDADLFASLTLANIADNREAIIRAFRVTDMPPTLVEERTVSDTFSGTGGGDSGKYAGGKELQIPDGYVMVSASVGISVEIEDPMVPNGGFSLGGDVQQWTIATTGNQGQASLQFDFSGNPRPGPTVAYAVNADNFTSFGGTISVKLKLTDQAREQWAINAYSKVADRFESLRREYATAVIQASANQPQSEVNLPDGSRSWLERVVRSELQRSSIDVMRNRPVDYDLVADYPSVNEDGTLDAHPIVDLAALASAAPEVRFLQQAFEWEHLGWVLYPYFWGRRSEWSKTVVVAHPDPDFSAFLNAGAARVQIPVRPGFEAMVKHFMETGEVYEGEGLPKMGDPGYVTFIDEQLTSLGAPGEEIQWPPDNPREWDIVAPTSLLLLRGREETRLPAWDPANGQELNPP